MKNNNFLCDYDFDLEDDDSKKYEGQGYIGYSMSVNAYEAYENGEKPISKWSKKDFLDYIAAYADDNKLVFDMKQIKRIRLEVLKNWLLTETGYHHMTVFYNIIYFYKIDDNEVLKLLNPEHVQKLIARSKEYSERDKARQKQKKELEAEQTEERWVCEYSVRTWKNTPRKYFREKGTLKGDWFYLDSGGKKKVSGIHFCLVERLA